jgi:hypothetical protein
MVERTTRLIVGFVTMVPVVISSGRRSHATPRRLALLATGLPAASAAVAEERRGPRADAPAPAIEGFLKSTGLTRDSLEERDTGKGIFLFATLKSDGRHLILCEAKADTMRIIVNAGLDHILNVQFHATTQVNPWYVGLKLTGSAASVDTLATHSGWTEATGYADNRKEYNEAAASGESITNSANKASFAISGTATIAGAFVVSVSAGATGTLFCVADFTSARAVENGDTLEVTYTISAADDGV